MLATSSFAELLAAQRQHIEPYFTDMNLQQLEAFFDACWRCSGLLYFCGMGKSGIIAEKIAMTLSSTGTRAASLSAVNAMHGDLGMLSPDDTVIFFSKSGQTDEILQLLPFIKNRGCKTLAVVCLPNSRLEQACDFTLHLPMGAELCPFDLAPTTSAVVQLLLGDLLTVAMMQHNGFSLASYGLNHPAGRIGKRITLRVRDLMRTGSDVPLAAPTQTLQDVLPILSDKRCGCVLITQHNARLVGIFTDGDLRRSLQNQGPQVLSMTMEQLMTKHPRGIPSQALAHEAMQDMERDPRRRIMMLPVVDDKKLVGLIQLHDIIQAGL